MIAPDLPQGGKHDVHRGIEACLEGCHRVALVSKGRGSQQPRPCDESTIPSVRSRCYKINVRINTRRGEKEEAYVQDEQKTND